MKVLVSGSHGLVGRALVEALQQRGDDVVRLVRGTAAEGDVAWNPAAGTVDVEALAAARVDAVVHLAGEPLLGRWTSRKRERIKNSRVNGTRAVAEAIAGLERKPQVFVCASAVGFYGNCGDRELTEQSTSGEGFLASVVREWEAAADPARDAEIRTVHMRAGVVLSPDGGAVQQLLLPFQLGLGGPIGSGRQYLSWVSRRDLIRALLFVLETPAASGAINAVGPTPSTNREFGKALGRVLHRPAVVPTPPFALKLALSSGLVTEMLLASQRALPDRLIQLGFEFTDETVEAALRYELGKT